jgi:membrane-bound metal-dependent hydrolase YbcI (DUF457 family)
MDLFSHFLIGLLTASIFTRPMDILWILYAGLMAGLPDVDVLLIPLNKIHRSFYFQHRGGSHTLLTAVIVSAFTGLIFWNVTGYSFLMAWLIGCLFYCLHLGLDSLTTYRVPLFYPFSKKEIKLGFELAVNPVLMFISLGIELVFLNIPFGIDQYEQITLILALIYYTYLIYRIVLKKTVQKTLGSTGAYFPGPIPFLYYTYQRITTEKSIIFMFRKHVSPFGKEKVLLQSELFNESAEFDLYLQARE